MMLTLVAVAAVSSAGLRSCRAVSPTVTDAWCEANCDSVPPNCPSSLCECDPAPVPPPPPPTPPPTPGPAIGHAIIGYWGSAADKPKLSQLPEALRRGYTVICLAFGDTIGPDGSFQINTNLGEPPSKARHKIQQCMQQCS